MRHDKNGNTGSRDCVRHGHQVGVMSTKGLLKAAFKSMENTSQDSKSMVFILTRRYTKSNSVCDLGRTMLASFC